MMTEADAKKKWCPFARQSATVETPFGGVLAATSMNRSQEDTPHGACIASACMAWRKRVHHENRDKREPEDERIGKYSADGYCGLAGRPE